MAQIISLREANQRFARLMRAVEEGGEFVVTRRGRPVARIIPAARAGGRLTAEQEDAIARIKAVAAKGYRRDDAAFDRAALHDR